MSTADALECGRYQHRHCLWGAIAALKGLAVLPVELQTAASRQVVQNLAESLLDADYDFAGEHKRWLTFGVPRAWDLLSALKALAVHGYAGDRRFLPLLERVLQLQDARRDAGYAVLSPAPGPSRSVASPASGSPWMPCGCSSGPGRRNPCHNPAIYMGANSTSSKDIFCYTYNVSTGGKYAAAIV